MSKKREWIGIVLLLIAIAGFVVWENWGRAYYRTTDVMVTGREIPAGTELSAEMFVLASIENESVMEGALTPAEINTIRGKRAAVTIPKNAQISDKMLRDADCYIADEESVFVLKGEWIELRSSSLRRGDWIDLYSISDGDTLLTKLGTFRVCFVKDANEAEIRATNEPASTGYETTPALNRVTATAQISSVEILATVDAYTSILETVLSGNESLLLVQVPG